jgi:hypothetical protein
MCLLNYVFLNINLKIVKSFFEQIAIHELSSTRQQGFSIPMARIGAGERKCILLLKMDSLFLKII